MGEELIEVMLADPLLTVAEAAEVVAWRAAGKDSGKDREPVAATAGADTSF